MSDLLADLDGWDDPTRIEWHPIYTRFGDVLTAGLARELCRDCGRTAGYNQGGANEHGAFMVCDACAAIDRCRPRIHECEIGRWPNPYISTQPVVIRCTCGWWDTALHHNDDGEWVEWTPAELVDIAAEHQARDDHASHWGMVHDAADHDERVEAQAKRRAAFLASDRAQQVGM